MRKKGAEELLKAEKGTVIKPRGGRTAVALVYPNTYYVGMSNLGLQAVYRLINGRKDALCERVFLPPEEKAEKAEKAGTPPFSVETKTPVGEFEILAFSVSFENDYINVATTLRLAGVPPFSAGRGDGFPLVILGGICTSFNPEPIAGFFDAVIVGEAEQVLPEFLDLYELRKLELPRAELLRELSKIPGVYVPSLYNPLYNQDMTLKSMAVSPGAPERILRRHVADIDDNAAKSVIITPNTEFSDMFLVELSRGCGRHCRFCMAGYVSRPPRSRSFESVAKDIREGMRLTKKIGLVGAAVSDYPYIAMLADEFADAEINFSASSLRADSLTPELVRLVSKGNRTVAIAPEAGSERLRAVINKNLTEEQILRAVGSLIEGGVLNVKLYFMVGLPTEEDGDVDAIAALSMKAREAMLGAAKARGRVGNLILSVNCFIPKPWTPFQWEPMEPVDRLLAKIRSIEKALKGVPNVSVIHDVPKWAYLQCALSRGDRRLAKVILAASDNGGDWKAAFAAEGLDMDFYAGRVRGEDERFPWEIIDTGIDRDYLRQEYARAGRACHTPACKVGTCKLCGVC
ncbi:MAG TPA: TIGR03960 family B12-binding radical SAM protein [Nitrospirota bacterium]|nr:TIGR03960 family B12-binding radical SAM protein [Nitrospirota bacterium]